MRREGRLLVLCLAAIVVAGLAVIKVTTAFSHDQAETNWRNTVEACVRANPKWRVITEREEEATVATSPTRRAVARRRLARIRAPEHVRRDGTTECGPAYPEPDAPPEP